MFIFFQVCCLKLSGLLSCLSSSNTKCIFRMFLHFDAQILYARKSACPLPSIHSNCSWGEDQIANSKHKGHSTKSSLTPKLEDILKLSEFPEQGNSKIPISLKLYFLYSRWRSRTHLLFLFYFYNNHPFLLSFNYIVAPIYLHKLEKTNLWYLQDIFLKKSYFLNVFIYKHCCEVKN